MQQQTSTKPKIIKWEKCRNPYDIDEDKNFNDEEDELEEDFIDDLEQNDRISNPSQNMKGLITPMGIIPIDEHTNPYKIFNFWIAHINFRLTDHICGIIDDTEGIETFNIFTPYRFRVAIGKAFVSSEVKTNLSTRLGIQVKDIDKTMPFIESIDDEDQDSG